MSYGGLKLAWTHNFHSHWSIVFPIWVIQDKIFQEIQNITWSPRGARLLIVPSLREKKTSTSQIGNYHFSNVLLRSSEPWLQPFLFRGVWVLLANKALLIYYTIISLQGTYSSHSGHFSTTIQIQKTEWWEVPLPRPPALLDVLLRWRLRTSTEHLLSLPEFFQPTPADSGRHHLTHARFN